ncbi:ABC transporter substrate-binding protein [Bradyrhizobium sp. CCGUVB1N3]|uniref:ABC transporter substrate-binding protein n=1 Tax=Bradyrhizobium sp. CCGUVB1N3 TaxID=2949629 RepID=UPI0020B1F7BD|nr:ABC transporter substrate-binding protein [Bradyrhizobium sp. CCGUVB1N3]MCP3472252.1 ABC transporter substrate-binding protein [Bradyrhizobium sp. CCGUVB1N3]
MSNACDATLSRRQLMRTAAGGLALTLAAPTIARAQTNATIVIAAGGGAYEQAMKETVIQPFMEATGIEVLYKTQLAESHIKAQVNGGNVEVDAAELTGTPFRPHPEELLEEIDYAFFEKETMSGLLPEAKAKYGVGSYIYSSVMAYSLADWPSGKPRPQTWMEFWDLKRYPGLRTLQEAGAGHPATLAFALIAAGADPNNLYPLDLDRAFKSLDAIKSHIPKFWTAGAEPAQLLSDRQVVIGSAWNGRIQTLKDQGASVDLTWNQGELSATYWVVPRGTRRKEAVMRFLAYASAASTQARLQSRMAYGPTNVNALHLMDQKVATQLPTAPGNIDKQFWRNDQWLNAIGSSGKSNRDTLIDRWTKWVAS